MHETTVNNSPDRSSVHFRTYHEAQVWHQFAAAALQSGQYTSYAIVARADEALAAYRARGGV